MVVKHVEAEVLQHTAGQVDIRGRHSDIFLTMRPRIILVSFQVSNAVTATSHVAMHCGGNRKDSVNVNSCHKSSTVPTSQLVRQTFAYYLT